MASCTGRCRPSRGLRAHLSALSRVPSYRSELGLIEYKSEEWPDELRIDGDGTVAGVYERQRCRWSCVFGALWKRRPAGRRRSGCLCGRPLIAPLKTSLSSRRARFTRTADTHAVLEVPFKADAEPEEEDASRQGQEEEAARPKPSKER